ncbi:MAG: hypothetical protein JNM51_16395 [Bacteroidia bacterium]|nr:hypothetical protein [Bacteroidia bacterium]
MFRYITSLFITIVLLSCGQKRNDTSFDKIVFHTSSCFGFCPVYHMEIDKNKNVLLYSQAVYKDNHSFDLDSNKTGYFTGLAIDTTFEKLSSEVAKIGIDTLNFKDVLCCDGSVTTIIIYYNGKRKFLQSMVPPAKARKLISTLYDICETSKVKRTSEKFIIESEKASR